MRRCPLRLRRIRAGGRRHVTDLTRQRTRRYARRRYRPPFSSGAPATSGLALLPGFPRGQLSLQPWPVSLSVSSPRPSNRACGSPAHGLPTFFTGGIRLSRPERAPPPGDRRQAMVLMLGSRAEVLSLVDLPPTGGRVRPGLPVAVKVSINRICSDGSGSGGVPAGRSAGAVFVADAGQVRADLHLVDEVGDLWRRRFGEPPEPVLEGD
jgi:hypothetical protein